MQWITQSFIHVVTRYIKQYWNIEGSNLLLKAGHTIWRDVRTTKICAPEKYSWNNTEEWTMLSQRNVYQLSEQI